MKNILLTTALIGLALPAYAGNYIYATGETQEVVPPDNYTPPAPSPFAGLYVGLRAGMAGISQTEQHSVDIYEARDVTECWKWWQNDWNRQLDERYCSGGFEGMNQHYFDNARERVVGSEEYFVGTETWEETTSERFGIYGIQAGYLFDLGVVLAGVEISHDFYNSTEFDITGVTAAKARVGYDGGRIQPYAFIGYAWASGVTDEGLAYGGGLDIALTDRIIAGVQYSQYDFANLPHSSVVATVSYNF